MIDGAGKSYSVDENGFLKDPDQWSEEFAQAYSQEEGIEGPLTEAHWKVIRYLRDHFKQFGVAPVVRKLCKDTEMDLKTLYRLFPSGPARGACKLAGLSRPACCV